MRAMPTFASARQRQIPWKSPGNPMKNGGFNMGNIWEIYGKYDGKYMGNMMESMGSKQNEPVPSRKMCGWRVCCTTSYLGLV
jgi:hypothetical protein